MEEIAQKLIPTVADAIRTARSEDPKLEKSSVRISRETIIEVFESNEEAKELLKVHSRSFIEEVQKTKPEMSEEELRKLFVNILIEAFIPAQDEVLLELAQ